MVTGKAFRLDEGYVFETLQVSGPPLPCTLQEKKGQDR